jgi:F-type H+-transporting ATPase subunit epsilon
MFTLSVVSPIKKIKEIKCRKVTVPTKMGPITVLPNHTPLFSLLSSGEVTLINEIGVEESIVVSGGFISVSKSEVLLLVDFGIISHEIDERKITEAVKRAEKILEEGKSENMLKSARANLLHANLQLRFLAKLSKRKN